MSIPFNRSCSGQSIMGSFGLRAVAGHLFFQFDGPLREGVGVPNEALSRSPQLFRFAAKLFRTWILLGHSGAREILNKARELRPLPMRSRCSFHGVRLSISHRRDGMPSCAIREII